MSEPRADRAHQYESKQYRDILVRVAANVRRLRDAAGLSQAKAAERCEEMEVRVYQLVEGAETNLTATTLARLCKGFEVDVLELLAPVEGPLPKRKRGRPKQTPPEEK